jgi:hypothetical protein
MNELAVFGKLTWVKSVRARNLSVKIMADGLRITLPGRYTEKDALLFIQKEYDRILLKQKKIQDKSQNSLLNEHKELKTATFTVSFKRANRKDVFFKLKQDKLIVEVPEDSDFNSEKLQKACWNGIIYFLKKEAKRILPDRTAILARQYGFRFNDIKIQSSKTRWGSCSRKKSINLSCFLMLVPTHLYDYVILHELCHTIELNHGDKFWELMNKVTDGKALKLRQELKNYQMPDY